MQNIDTLMEDYILGKLSPEDVVQFEQFLAQDPKNQSHLDLQKDILNGIKEHSRHQLKSRLAQVQPSTTNLFTQKIAIVLATFATVALVGIGIYGTTQYNQTTTNASTTAPQTVTERVEQAEVEPKQEIAEGITSITPSDLKPKLVLTEEIKTQKPETLALIKEEAITPKADLAVQENMVPKPFNPLKDLANDDETELGTNSDLVTDIGPHAVSTSAPKIDRIECQGNQKIESYRYHQGQLEICGEFSSKNTFEITVSEALDHAIFFSYDGSYYQIIESEEYERMSSHKITDLKTIQKITQK